LSGGEMMKAKLIIDMPDNCSECRLWRFTQMGFMVCAANGKLLGAENSHEKPDWCPLEPISEESILKTLDDIDEIIRIGEKE
jgi:hypothetical protein